MNETLNTYGTDKGERVINPIKTPKQIVLFGTIGAEKTNLFMDDACGMAGALTLVGTGTGTAMDVAGAFTVSNIKEFLKSFAIIVSRYNLNSSVAADLSNNLEIIQSKLDGTFENDFIFSSLSVSNMQYNPDLLNVAQGFVWTTATALKLLGTAATIYTITLAIQKVVPYGKLDEFLAANPMYKTA